MDALVGVPWLKKSLRSMSTMVQGLIAMIRRGRVRRNVRVIEQVIRETVEYDII
jgi:hypothetical protein